MPLVDGVSAGADPLDGIALGPPEPHADDGRAEVVSGLDEVAGEDAEAAGVRRELLVEPELHREVGDTHGSGVGQMAPPTGTKRFIAIRNRLYRARHADARLRGARRRDGRRGGWTAASVAGRRRADCVSCGDLTE
ncbi:MAG: hypothetical protein DMD79_18460 [Candidatus Rokuibacteriota bacterium]|nr:MAG: hypothetical protein DMD79_18460 [Candidatus Rokubacteria bacterium]